ncbi:MAG TPA: hypothetical protein VMW04_04460 [Patescibacteria group bacterium]|nr:hypothetical protein [Patescibacteria group bacterium]
MKAKNQNRPKITKELIDFFENIIVPHMDKRFDGVDKRFDGVESRLGKVENHLEKLATEMTYVKNDIRDLKADMPTKKEFAVVKKLEKIHQTELAALA